MQVESLAKHAVHACPWKEPLLHRLASAAVVHCPGKASAAKNIAGHLCKSAPPGKSLTSPDLQSLQYLRIW